MVGVALFLSAPPPPPPVFAPSGPSGLAESTCLTSTTPSEEPYVSASASPSHPLSPHAHSLLAASSHLPLLSSPSYLTSPALLSPSPLYSTTPPQLSWPHFTTSILWQPLSLPSSPSPTCSSPFPISPGSPLYLSPLLTPLQLTFTASAFFCHPFTTSHLSHPLSSPSMLLPESLVASHLLPITAASLHAMPAPPCLSALRHPSHGRSQMHAGPFPFLRSAPRPFLSPGFHLSPYLSNLPALQSCSLPLLSSPPLMAVT